MRAGRRSWSPKLSIEPATQKEAVTFWRSRGDCAVLDADKHSGRCTTLSLRRLIAAPLNDTSARSQSSETICTPFFAADAVVDKKEARRVVLAFHRKQLWIIRPPEGSLPRAFE